MNFLYGERRKIAEKIDTIEGQLKEANLAMEEESEKLKNIDKNIEEITKRIIELGKKEKNAIIEKAQITAKQMVQDAKTEVEYKLEAARKQFGEEMLETAVSLAVNKLKEIITMEDDEKLIDGFATGLSRENPEKRSSL